MSADPVRRRVLVTGHVQGVYFRESTRREAVAAGVRGWVQNLPDGRFEAAFEGPPVAVDALLAWVRRGPSKARVTGVQVVEEPRASRSTADRVGGSRASAVVVVIATVSADPQGLGRSAGGHGLRLAVAAVGTRGGAAAAAAPPAPVA